MQVRPGCEFVLEWNLPFRNPGSATVVAVQFGRTNLLYIFSGDCNNFATVYAVIFEQQNFRLSKILKTIFLKTKQGSSHQLLISHFKILFSKIPIFINRSFEN